MQVRITGASSPENGQEHQREHWGKIVRFNRQTNLINDSHINKCMRLARNY